MRINIMENRITINYRNKNRSSLIFMHCRSAKDIIGEEITTSTILKDNSSRHQQTNRLNVISPNNCCLLTDSCFGIYTIKVINNKCRFYCPNIYAEEHIPNQKELLFLKKRDIFVIKPYIIPKRTDKTKQ